MANPIPDAHCPTCGFPVPDGEECRRNDDGTLPGADLVLRLPGGATIETNGDLYAFGAEVTIRDEHGEVAGHWTRDEWRDDPECVMGAILACAARADGQI